MPYNKKKAEQTEKSATVLELIREGKAQGKPLPPRLGRQMNKGVSAYQARLSQAESAMCWGRKT